MALIYQQKTAHADGA